MGEPYVYTQKDAWSGCCGAGVYDDSDICSDCKEHCAVMTYCPDCDGTGEIEVMDMDTVHSQSDSLPENKTIKCETCNGEREIELWT